MAAKIVKPSACNPHLSNLLTVNRGNSLYFKPVSTLDVLTYVEQLNANICAGPKGIPIKFTKLTACVIPPFLMHLFNKSLITGTFPSCLKIGEIVPMHKSGPKNQCSNYKPITILSPF